MMYRDRRLAITPHAVNRLRERAGVAYLDEDLCRRVIAQAVADAAGDEEAHPVRRGQTRVRVRVLGVDVFAIIGRDRTGWSTSGRAVVTVLTPSQIRFGDETHRVRR